jgi:hypothetical protein
MARRNLARSLAMAVSLGTAISLLGDCVVATSGEVVVVDTPPPPPRPVQVSARPGFVWVDGYWVHRGDQWVWRDGYWERERPGYLYVQGRWTKRAGRWHWVEPRWDRATAGGRARKRGHPARPARAPAVREHRERTPPPAVRDHRGGDRKKKDKDESPIRARDHR